MSEMTQTVSVEGAHAESRHYLVRPAHRLR